MILYFGILIGLVVVLVGCVATVLKMCKDAPEGYEDELGFHYGWRKDVKNDTDPLN